MQNHFNVLFLCTGNSARSIMAEAIMNKQGFPIFTAYSAGSHPTGRVHPQALRQLEIAKLSADQARSKDWNEFVTPGAPELHFVFNNIALEFAPDFALAYFKRGLARQSRGDFSAALGDYSKGVEIAHWPEAFYDRGTLLLKEAERAGSVADFASARSTSRRFSKRNKNEAAGLELRRSF
jgi:hypothetical protein